MKHITPDEVRDVCKIGQGADACRYIIVTGNGFMCARESGMRDLLDMRVAEGTYAAEAVNCGEVADEITGG